MTGGEVQIRKKRVEERKRRKERGTNTQNKQHLKESRRKTEAPDGAPMRRASEATGSRPSQRPATRHKLRTGPRSMSTWT